VKLHLFIAAISGRALAQAAHELGVACTVADCFGDADTRRYAHSLTQIACDDEPLRIDEHKLLQALHDCAAHCQRLNEQLCVVTGTGFEGQLEILRSLQHSAEAAGAVCAFNDAQVMSNITNPQLFFAALDELGAHHPATQATPPSSTQANKRWWVKQRGGYGASHIRPFSNTHKTTLEHIYYQEDTIGSAYSMCTNSYISHIVYISMNQQLIAHLPHQRRQYQGAIAARPADAAQAFGIAAPLQEQLIALTQSLCERFKLRGLLSLDFILSDNKAYVLEVNARPTATFELLDGASALARHLKAFGVSIDIVPHVNKGRMFAGHRYVFAPHDVQITHSLERSLVQQDVMQAITDWPVMHTSLPAGAPLCNLHAQAESLQAVQALLDTTEHLLVKCVLNEAQPLRRAA
jgi:uncharacterized protein